MYCSVLRYLGRVLLLSLAAATAVLFAAPALVLVAAILNA
jgi:hypothetical protein